MRWTSLFAAVAGALLIPASPAAAGTLTTQNSCKWTDGYWRHLDVDLTGTGSPAPVAPGSGVNLTAASVHVRLPDYLAQAGHGLGILKAGENEFQARAWVAIAAPATPQGVQVFALQTVARTTITEDASGAYQSSTPIDVTVPLPDSAWSAGTAPVAFSQAGAGSLPPLPVGSSGGNVQPTGSAFISATIGTGGLKLNIDCQPGTGEGTAPPTAAVAGAFETVGIEASAPVITPPAVKAPVLTLRTTKLKRSGRSVSVSIACADAPCKGTVSMTKATKKVAYLLAAGSSRTVRFTLSTSALKTLKTKPLLVTVKATNAGGKTVSKKLRLK
ncbi:hypothetical protein [Solirubrobacter soli]|uniref:hypothetical protein n=1 Tax=Solirubrobacter soli TaxID=363832 RepID=UPI0004153BF9|nr:hypothetical protein [Solirubrobacter soli]